MLSVLGAINWDISVFEERFARAGEEVPVTRVEEFSGGKGANVAVASARVLGKGAVAYLGALGDDTIRSRQLAELAAEGVVLDGLVRIEGCQSGRAYIIIDAQGRKTIHTHFGANSKITPRHIQRGGCAEVIGKTGMIVVMDPPVPVAIAAAKAAQRSGAKVIYSPGVRTQGGARALEGIMRMADFLVVDRIELMNLEEGETEEGILAMLSRGHPGMTVVVTLGSSGCMVATAEGTTRIPGISVSSFGAKVLNTTGCGDAFLGVFASYLHMGSTALEAARWANLAGAIKATRLETRGSPKRRDLERVMQGIETKSKKA